VDQAFAEVGAAGDGVVSQGVAFSGTAGQRKTVRAMSGFGVPQEEIATFFDIDPKTLRKHFRLELDKGGTEATAKVAQSLFRMATEGNNVAAAIFWMKARAGWSDRQRVEHGFAGPFAVFSGVERADDLTDDELARIASSGRDEDDTPRPRGPNGKARYVISVPEELSQEEWIARHGHGAKP
jgi:hypothetical protein